MIITSKSPIFTRREIAEDSDLSLSKLDNLVKAGVLVPDIGNERKRFSVREQVLARISAALLRLNVSPKTLVEPIGWLRSYLALPKEVDPNLDLDKVDIWCRVKWCNAVHLHGVDGAQAEMPALIEAGLNSYLRDNLFGEHLAVSEFLSNGLPDLLGQPQNKYPDEDSRANLLHTIKVEAQKFLDARDIWAPEVCDQAGKVAMFQAAVRGRLNPQFILSISNDSWIPCVSYIGVPADATEWLAVDIAGIFSLFAEIQKRRRHGLVISV